MSRLLELSDRELVHLSRFSGLKQLDLSHTPIQSLPNLSGLKHLERANFAHSRIEQIELLRGMTQLKSLNLAGTIIQPNSAEALGTLTGLEELILDSTKMDSFGLLDLRKLTNLKRISLIDVDLREADLNTFRAALPACKVVTEK